MIIYKNKRNFIFNIIENNIKNKNIIINTRFSPDPNGFLHIGHVKSILINYNIHKLYNGKFNIRFDDTNPLTSKLFYVNNIIRDIKWLGFNYTYISYTSDYFNRIFYYALILIKKKLAYVDELSINNFIKYKGNFIKKGLNSPYRNRSIDDNIKCFINMKNGLYKENEACLRAKIDMNSDNIIMRDPVLYRIKFVNHFRTQYNWCIYPTYDFSHCISDYIENINYSLCTKEFENNKYIYNWILDSLFINNKPKQYEFSKLNIDNYIISKRKFNILIKKKIISSLNDTKILTISGLRNKGYTNLSIIEFCNNIGITKDDSCISINYLYNFLRKDLYKNSIKIMSVLNPIFLYILNFNKNLEIIFKLDSNNNKKKIIFSNLIYVDKFDFCNDIINEKNIINSIIKLRYSYIIKIIKIEKNFNNDLSKIYCIYYKNTINSLYINNKKVKKIIHWVSSYINYKTIYKINKDFINTNYLKKNKFNNNLFFKKIGYTEKVNLKISNRYQLERVGYFYVKKINIKNNNLLLIYIIDINKSYFL